ncbi:MAG: hypothetical protein ACE5EC_09145, partial [Phycisphaerae bacterium]
GDYHLRVIPFDDFSTGSYTLQIRSRRPSAETELNASEQQIIFLDFDGASINANDIFGFGSTNATLSPLSDFLPRWGLLPTDEDAVIDAIIAAFEENFDSLRLATLNGDRDTDNTNGHFDIEIQNSRDDTDVFDQPVVEPNFSRIIIGGTIDELGIGTIGIAQFIDPGNFSREDTAVVLLDLLSASPGDPNSLNQFNLSGGMSKIDLIGVGVGNVAAHEAGHYLGCWHTNNGLDQSGFCSLNFTPNLMDTGGCIEEIVGVGNDFQFGTADDINVGFVGDAYEPFEPIGVGRERTDVRVAFALATGIGLSISSETPSRGSELAALLSVAVVFTRDVTGVTAASLTVNGSAATNLTGSDRGPYLFEGFTPPSEGMVAVILSETGIEDSVGEPFTGDSWNYTILDTTSPTLSSEVPPRGSVVTDLSNIRVNMSESITGVVAGSLTVNGSAATAIAANDPNGDSYTFSGFALPDPGTVTVDFSGSGIMDVAGNAFSGATWTYELERESLTTDPDDSTLVLNLGGNVRIEPDESLTLGGSPTVSGGAPPYDLEWTLRGNPDVMSSTESNPVFGPASEGIYVVRLIVTDQDGATKIGYTTILVGEGGGTLGLSPTADPLVPGCGQTCAPNMGTFLSAMGLCYLAALRIRRRRRS